MVRGEPEPFCLDRQARITESCSCFAFQQDQRLRETLISSDTHHVHVGHKIAIREEKFSGKDLCADFQTLVEIRLIAIRNTEIPIAEKVFELMGHRENHWILRQTFCQHHRRTQVVIDKGTAQMSESIRPFINDDAVPGVNSHEIIWENAW